MKFIVDAQLLKSLADFLNYKGYDALHTLDLPAKNYMSDSQIIDIAMSDSRIVITKDADFLDAHLLKSLPSKLILVKTGNITNKQLLEIFSNKLDIILDLIAQSSLVEVTRQFIIQH